MRLTNFIISFFYNTVRQTILGTFRFLFVLFSFLFSSHLIACQCPLTQLSMKECDKYEIIFKGKIVEVKDCGNKLGEAYFDVEELYKGNSEQRFKVLFECSGDCVQKFTLGDEWIIYSRYKQLDNALMDWCSRSRKFFQQDKEDFYTYTYGNDYVDEVNFLRKHLGLHRTMAEQKDQSAGRNIKPDMTESMIIVLISLGAIVLFYYLFNKFFK